MTSTKKRLLLIVVVVMLVASLATAGMLTAFAVTTSDTIEYPFRTGGGAFGNAPIWKGLTTQADGDSWQFLQVNFTSTDFTSVDYVALQIKVNSGDPGLTFGLMGNGDRYGTYSDKTNGAYFVSANGTIRGINLINGGYINLGANAEGMLLVPMNSMSWVGWASANKDLAKTSGIFLETNGKYNWNFEFVIGEIGYYVGDPADGGTFTKVFDLSAGEKQSSYYNGLGSQTPLTFPSELEVVDPIPDMTIAYPFATGETAFKGGMQWTGPANQYVPAATEPADNWQTFKVRFDDGAADLTNASYIAVQYMAKSGTPGLTYGLTNNNARYSISGHDNDKVYVFNEKGTCISEVKIQFSASNVSSTGMLLIPMSSMGWQFGSAENKSLEAITEILFTTNSLYNWNYEIVIGEVGYYTGDLADGNFTKLVDLTKGTNESQYVVTSDVARDRGSMTVYKVDRMTYGDVTLTWTATGKTANQFSIWDGGSMGKVEMVTDSYGDDAAQLTCTGANPSGDKYTATTIADGIRWQWAGMKGVTLWARNDSDIEVSFNLEMDVTNPNHIKANGSHNARHNIKQGGRFWLYDVNTGKQTIYMARPCVTLPVGFEGWVYVPFTDFYQADWSVDEGVMARSMFINADGSMANGSYVSYLAITVFSGDYINKPFSINKIGAYATTPTFSSAILGNTDKSIPSLMELPALPQTNGEDK